MCRFSVTTPSIDGPVCLHVHSTIPFYQLIFRMVLYKFNCIPIRFASKEIEENVECRIRVRWLKWRLVFGKLYDWPTTRTRLKGKLYKIAIGSKFYKIVIRSAMIYVAKCWPIKKEKKQKMKVAKMRC